MPVQKKTRVQKVGRIVGAIVFSLLMLFSFDLTYTSAAPSDPCLDICRSQPNRICTYMIGHGYCIGVGIWE